jgi:hypothetical protein
MAKRAQTRISERTGLPKQGQQGEGGGRPRFEINYEDVERLGKMKCTQEEIAAFLGCSVDTLLRDEKFCELYKRAIENGRMSLRRLQWAAAEGGNPTMLVWLGKQYLGQTDKQQLTGENNGPVKVQIGWMAPE